MKQLPLEGLVWSDVRGWGLRPLEAAGVAAADVAEVHVVSLEPGAVRGNHLHPDTTEWMLLFGGRMAVACRGEQGAPEIVEVEGAAPVLVELPAGVAHAVRCDADHTTYLVSWADGIPRSESLAEPLL